MGKTLLKCNKLYAQLCNNVQSIEILNVICYCVLLYYCTITLPGMYVVACNLYLNACAGWIRPSATRAWPCLNVAGLSQHRHPRLAARLAGRPGRPCI